MPGLSYSCNLKALPTQPRLSELEVGRKDMAQWNELMEGLPEPFAEPAQKRERDEPKEEEPSRATRAPKTTQGEKGGAASPK